MKALVGFALVAAMVLALPAAAQARVPCSNNLKQLGLGVTYEVDFLIPDDLAPAAFDDDSLVLRLREAGCVSCATLDVTYFTLAAGGGLSIADETGLRFSGVGEQLFTGSTARPTFRLGTFTFAADRDGGAIDAVLSVTGVPEPASWALMIAGFGFTGAAARRRGRAGARAA